MVRIVEDFCQICVISFLVPAEFWENFLKIENDHIQGETLLFYQNMAHGWIFLELFDTIVKF